MSARDREGYLERRNGEPTATKEWRALADPKPRMPGTPIQYTDKTLPAPLPGGRLERIGRFIDAQARLQWDENKVGIGFAFVFIVISFAILLI